jgi:hypothetical protein
MSSQESHLLVNDYVLSFDELIGLHKRTIGSFKKWLGCSVLVGFTVITIAVLLYWRLQGLAPPIVGIGGFLITGSVAFPYREINFRRSEIIKYTHLKRRFERFPDLSEEERRRTFALADDMIKRNS